MFFTIVMVPTSLQRLQTQTTPECAEYRHAFYVALNLYRLHNTDTNRVNMVNKGSRYKTCFRKARYEYYKRETNTFLNAKLHNAKLYWNILKSCAHVGDNNIPLESFELYFKSINNPEDRFFSADEDILHFIERYENNEFNIMFDILTLTNSL